MRGPDLERIFREHAQGLYGFLVYRTGSSSLAEDLLGDAFERLVRSGHRFDRRKGTEQAWVYTIALNCLRDHARHAEAESRALQRVAAGGDPVAHGGLDGVESRDLVLRGLDRLEPAERDVVALRYGADLRLQDIARLINEPESTVQARLYRGLRKLRADLGEP
jgi:RNA polymerase sigma-70 factor (ECF subfamily)